MLILSIKKCKSCPDGDDLKKWGVARCKMAIALSGKYSYLLSVVQIIIVMKEVKGMSKSQDTKKNKKTPPQKTAKEKKQAKREKKNK